MFRTSCVHHQDDRLYMQFCMVRFSCLCEQSSVGRIEDNHSTC